MKRKRYNGVAEDLVEYYSGRSLYVLVLEFHKAFGHDYNPSTEPWDRRRLNGKDRTARGKWMAEEIMEYIEAGDADQVDQVDSLVDLMYFILGTFVMIGYDPLDGTELSDMEEYGRRAANRLHEKYSDWHPPAADRLYMGSLREWRVKSGKYAISLVFEFIESTEMGEGGQIPSLMKLLRWTLKEAAIVGADLKPYFLIVHTSNMSKLWADGRPRYNSDGKIRKPETWQSPRKEMEKYMLMRLQKEDEDAEIPF